MEQDVLIDAIGKHLDALSALVNWAVGLAIITIWTAAQRAETISLLGMDIKRKGAFYLLGVAFSYVNIMAVISFFRIGNLLEAINVEHLPEALTILGANAWPFNPYAYFGSSYTALAVSNFGYGGLIAIWWIGYTALAMCRDDRKSLGYISVVGAFLLIGLLSMGAIQYVFLIILDKANSLNFTLRAAINAQSLPRSILTFAGIAIGWPIFMIAQNVKANRSEDVNSQE